MDYTEAERLLATARDKYAGKPIANNTRLHTLAGDAIGLRLHNTDVLTFYPDGSIGIDTGGWHTVTTWNRIGRYLDAPWRIYSDKGEWRWVHWSGERVLPFIDGMTILPDGGIGYQGHEVMSADEVVAEHDRQVTLGQERDAKRAERLTREHEAGPYGTYTAFLSYDYEARRSITEERPAFHKRGYGTPRGCPRCESERAA